MLVNGAPGLALVRDGRLLSVAGIAVSGGRIAAIDVLAYPDRLRLATDRFPVSW